MSLSKETKSKILDIARAHFPVGSQWKSKCKLELTKGHRSAPYPGVTMNIMFKPPTIPSGIKFEVLDHKVYTNVGWACLALKVKEVVEVPSDVEGWILVYNGSEEYFIEQDGCYQGLNREFMDDTEDLDNIFTRVTLISAGSSSR